MTTAFVLPSWVLTWAAFLPPLAALGAATLVRRAHARSGDTQPWVEAAVVGLTLVPLAVVVAWPALLFPARAALVAGLSVALLAHDPRDLPQTEVALKIMWVLTAAFALSWAGDALLAMASGSARARAVAGPGPGPGPVRAVVGGAVAVVDRRTRAPRRCAVPLLAR